MLGSSELPDKPFPVADGKDWPMAPVAFQGDLHLPSGKSWPKISIVTPSYNQGPYLEKTIRSVLLQGYPNLEYFVIDGGSTDQSVDIIKKYEPWIDNWVSEKDRGQSHAINKGLKMATGELLGWLNSDDYFLPGAFFKFGQTFLEDPSIGAICGQGHIIDERGEIIYTPKLLPVTKESLFAWCFGNDFMQPSCLFTMKSWEKSGPIDESLNFALDVEYWIRIAEKFKFKRISDVLSVSLSHSLAKTTSMRDRSHAELAIICMRYGAETQARRILNQILDRHAEEINKIISCRKMSFSHSILNIFRKLIGNKT